MLNDLGSQKNVRFPVLALDEYDKQILQIIEFISRQVSTYGYSVLPYSQGSLGKLSSFDQAKKIRALEQLEKLGKLLNSSFESAAVPMPIVDPVHSEKNLVDKALSFYNFQLKNDFWKTVEPHDIIEIYNDEGIQLFRTFNFFETSGYSLTDLLVNEWYVLWERPKYILQEIFKYSHGILTGEMSDVTKMTIPKHLVKEIYKGHDDMQFFTARSTLVEFSHICPLYDKENKTDRVVGIIVSSKATPNTIGDEETKKVIIF